VASIEELLLQTSRTFALSIPMLPEPTRRQVGVAYLLFRVADTLEDATLWTPARQVAELDRFAQLVRHPTPQAAERLAASWIADPPLRHDGYELLLAETPYVMREFEALAPEARPHITRHTLRTIERMAAFVERDREQDDLRLRDVADLQAYCYAVAGIVGEMLTELFILGGVSLGAVAGDLRARAATFGEALQLVNILKDAATDLGEGRSFLPAETDLAEVFALARGDLRTAGEYVGCLQRAGGPRGIVEFTAINVLMASATLDRVEREGPGAKLTRAEVTAILERMQRALDRGEPVIPQGWTDSHRSAPVSGA
jgi:farnesyl-diphosphate farnesyltransferase